MSARCAGQSEPATTIRHGQPSYTQAVTAKLRIATATLKSVQDDRVIRDRVIRGGMTLRSDRGCLLLGVGWPAQWSRVGARLVCSSRG
jgi:hypothetical protein